MSRLDVGSLVALENGQQPELFNYLPVPEVEPKQKYDTMMVVTCKKCRAWYSMDYEPHLPDDHFNMRDGTPCYAGDDDWDIDVVPYRTDWIYAK